MLSDSGYSQLISEYNKKNEQLLKSKYGVRRARGYLLEEIGEDIAFPGLLGPVGGSAFGGAGVLIGCGPLLLGGCIYHMGSISRKMGEDESGAESDSLREHRIFSSKSIRKKWALWRARKSGYAKMKRELSDLKKEYGAETEMRALKSGGEELAGPGP